MYSPALAPMSTPSEMETDRVRAQKQSRVEREPARVALFKNPKNASKPLRELRPYEQETEYLDRASVNVATAKNVLSQGYTSLAQAKTAEQKKNIATAIRIAKKDARRSVYLARLGKTGEELYAPLRAVVSETKKQELRNRIAERKLVNQRMDIAKGIDGFNTITDAEQYVADDPQYRATYSMKPAKGKEFKPYAEYKAGVYEKEKPFYLQNGMLVGGPFMVPETVTVKEQECVALPKAIDDRNMTRTIATYVNPFNAIPRRRVLFKVGYYPQE